MYRGFGSILYLTCGGLARFPEAWRIENSIFGPVATSKWNSCLGCLNVHSSTTPNRVLLKPPFEGVTGHPQNTLTIGSESLKGVLCKFVHSINSQLYMSS